ncbi:MAG TPA: hypothetical protein VFW96_23410 [Thermomicrobiales bacterium]|nr:hypothetical protein [Thermomicrobiales bacterium]
MASDTTGRASADHATFPEPPPPDRPTARLPDWLRAALTAALALALLLPLVLLDRPPDRPRLTVIGADAGLSLLLEGAGGGRVLVGAGASRAGVAAALGRFFPPWDRDLDLLLVTDARDLPGAVELVRQGHVRAVATLGLGDDDRAPALAALRDACAERGIALQTLAGGERVHVGRADRLTLETQPPADAGVALRVVAGPVALAVGAAGGAPLVLLPRGTADAYRQALAAGADLVIAPAPPPPALGVAPGRTRLLVVPTGARATLDLDGRTLRLRGPEVQPLAGEPSPPPR